jgi:hypothetical protein
VGQTRPAHGLGTPLFSGHIFRAVFTLGPPMWQCMSTPPGMTTSPWASMVRVGLTSGSVGGSTILLPAIQMSRTSPSIPFAGS